MAIQNELTKSTNAADIDAMVARTTEQFGRLDVLHNNAFGVPATLRQNRLARSAEIDQAVWDYTIQVGLTAVMQAIRATLPIMQRQGGGERKASPVSPLAAHGGVRSQRRRDRRRAHRR